MEPDQVDPTTLVPNAPAQLACRLDDDRWPARLTVTGDLDEATVDAFAAALRRATAEAPAVQLDLRGLTLLSAAGVRELYHHQHAIVSVLAAPSGIVHRILVCTGFAGPDGLPIVTDRPGPR